MESLYRKLLDWADENRPVILMTVVSPGSLQGEKRVYSESGEWLEGRPDAALDEVLSRFAVELMQGGMPRTETFRIEERDWEIYGEAVQAEPELFLFGGGHVSQAVARVAVQAGFRPVVVEDRAEFARPERFPEGTRFHVGLWEETVPSLPFHSNAYLAIMTRAHAFDTWILGQLIDRSWKYLAMIGSRKKVTEAFRKLMEQGVSRDRIERVHAPMGLDIGAQTPGEIAVSVVGEMIAVKYGHSVGSREPLLPIEG